VSSEQSHSELPVDPENISGKSTNLASEDLAGSSNDVSSDAGVQGGTQRQAASRWLEEHGDILWRFVLSRTRSREAAEDVVQSTILAALQSYDKFDRASSERTWLLAIATHKIADHFRAVRRARGEVEHVSDHIAEQTTADNKAQSKDQPSESPNADGPYAHRPNVHGTHAADGSWLKPPLKWGLDPSNASEKAEMLSALRACIDELTPALAQTVLMRDVLDVPSDVVCKELGLTPTNLWSRMHRARVALRQCVEASMGIATKGIAMKGLTKKGSETNRKPTP